ncbi:MAG: 30S ribosomal protein S3 [Nanoarchaeota archaeon]|nr:30S ribosomal protein S3 [Nanoarchaeota archaeon]
MIEREFVARKKLEFQIQEFISESLKGVGLSHSKLQRTPLGEKIIIYASRPGLIIGGGGTNIKKLTKQLKKKCGLENPQIEISEVENVNLVSAVVAERIGSALEKFGTMRFKGVGHKAMADAQAAGARGIEILISGKIPSARARTWRFYQGYLKKSGDVAVSQVDVAYVAAKLKSGIVGIKVSIMPPNVKLPDEINFVDTPMVEELSAPEAEAAVEEIKSKIVDEPKEAAEKKKKPRKKKVAENENQ